jgi:Tfp pilus assembly protein PilF
LKSCRNRLLLLAAALLVAALAVYADLPEWLGNQPAIARLEGVFFRAAPMPGGPVAVRRPPQETRAALSQLITATPAEAELHALRAQAAEEQLDFAAAEDDWKKFAELAADKGAGQLALADFYHRRLRPLDEIGALDAAGAQGLAPLQERLQPVAEQRSWRTFERAVALVEAQALPVETGMAQYRAWMARYPREQAPYRKFFDYLVGHKQLAVAGEIAATYQKTFSEDAVFTVAARARIEESRGSIEQALAVYDRAFQPLWPPELVKQYFGLLGRTHNLRRFLERARGALAANPNDLNAAVRIFYYYQQQGNLPAAQRALIEFRLRKQARKSAWSAQELWTLARLFEDTQQYQEAVRNYYEMYQTAGGGGGAERALAGIIRVLFTAPEQPIRFGAGDLSFYKDVATMDPYPGFLNGILSLLLNSATPQEQYADEDRASVAYFHRVRAAELMALFDSRFPNSPQRPELHSRLIQAYATYGDSDGVIRGGRKFLAAFPEAAERTEVAILMAEAFARKEDTGQEFATYEALLKELAARAGGVPLGTAAKTPPARRESEQGTEEETAEPPQARAGNYSSVLERYISRLVALKRPLEALRLLRRELDRNPNDPGLYERLAAFMQQNRIDAQTEEVYRRAIQQFGGTSWYDKLARWYLRRKQAAEFEKLTREVTGIFSGTELEKYFHNVVSAGSSGAALYLQLNLYAHQRFPYDMAFVHNLLSAYRSSHTWNPAAWEKLLRNYWYHDERLRTEFFRFLANSGRLSTEIEAARAAGAGNPAAVRFLGEAEAWRSHFEEAASPLDAAAEQEPGNTRLAHRAASLDRSLAAYDARFTEKAVAIEEKLHRWEPRDRAVLTELGEIQADRELFDLARPYWNGLAAIEPGKPEGYLEAATVFWDYYLYEDALRLIAEGRKKLGNAALYAYEAGAIYENKRDYTRAVTEYIKGAQEGSSARERLIKLSRRPGQRAIVEKLTIERTAGANPGAAAVSLRTAVLEAQNRRDDLVQFLLGVAGRSNSLDAIERVRGTAERLGLDEVLRLCLERQIAVATDPVERMRFRLALMRFHEGKRNLERARETVEALYAQNPAILGVVRATADFYWRNKMPGRAVDVLVAAAGAANATLKKQFTLEAAMKSTEAGDTGRARQLLAGLLEGDPFKPEYVAAMADTYVREGDDRGLSDFYRGRIREVPDDKLKLVLRRGLIPVLTRQKDYTAAVDQYIEIVKGYPEDEGVTREAATYASSHGVKERLAGYFAKAVADSPRDYRWPMVVARLDTFFEDIPGAIAAYSQATAIRPDRVDLHIARASLEERLMRFEEALRSYAKLYEQTYHDPQWMRKVAEVYARQGQTEAAVKALSTALIEGRAERPQPFFEVARILDSWNMLEPARRFAERGVELAGKDLFGDYPWGAQIYARIMTRLRAYEPALGRLEELPSERGPFESTLGEMGAAAKAYFTPEEKSALEAFLEKRNPPSLLRLASSAGLVDLEARWRFEQLMLNAGKVRGDEGRFSELQKRRMKYDDLALKLLAYWNAWPARDRDDHLALESAEAYRAAGDEAGEMAALGLAQQYYGLSGDALERYLELLLKRDPQRLVALAGNAREKERDAAANAAVASGNAELALQAVAARGRGLDAVWTKAYSGLVGLHYADAAPAAIEASFLGALGTGSIGERLGNKADRSQQLAGGSWFYYGTAYGEYLAAKKRGDPEDYLPALLEGTPARASAYFTLAEYYREEGDFGRALADYGHTLELDPKRGGVEDRIAEVLWKQGKREAAIAHWKAAFQAFRKALDGRVPETFWSDLEHALKNIGKGKLLPEVKQEADAVLRTYIRRNGSYRSDTLLGAAFEAAADPAAGTAWVLDLGNSAPNRTELLSGIVESAWLPKENREPVYRRILEAAEAEAAQFAMQQYRREEVGRWRVSWIGYLVDTKQTERARTELEALPEKARAEYAEALVPLEIRIAAQGGKVAQLIERYQREPEKAPALDTLLRIAGGLEPRAEARRLLEFVYTSELDQRNFTAANFLGLAELRLEEGNTDAVVTLLRRMTLVADEPFQDLEAAADLLNRTGHQAEARQFLEARVKAVPWDFRARVKLGDASVAGAPAAPYELRAQAAALKPGGKTGSAELDLLAGGTIAPAAAEQPFFYYARVKAAETAGDSATRIRLLRGAIAIEPEAGAARLPLVRAALAGGRYQLALSAMEPLLESGGLQYVLRQRSTSEITDASSYAQEFLSSSGLSGRERAALAEGLALAFEKTGRPGSAAFLYRIALAIEPGAEARAGIERLQAEEKRREQNALRRPVVSSGLEQERLVRVRIEGGKGK